MYFSAVPALAFVAATLCSTAIAFPAIENAAIRVVGPSNDGKLWIDAGHIEIPRYSQTSEHWMFWQWYVLQMLAHRSRWKLTWANDRYSHCFKRHARNLVDPREDWEYWRVLVHMAVP
ncbi:hypothetical protein C8Q77DRAFT_1075035 [Trametes polyzona]|nr:hypothetical protein C8Q77DRAFT_1075035 [Trametes polyzona]